MIKTIFIFLVGTSFAATPSRFDVELSIRKGQQIEKSQIAVVEGEDGVIFVNSGPSDKSTFSVIVHPLGDGKVNLSYRVVRQWPEARLDFARADISMKTGAPLIVTAKDDQEDEVEMSLSVLPKVN